MPGICANLKQIAPAFLTCGEFTPGGIQEAGPGLGWINIVPAALSKVDLTINGTQISFTGIGHHLRGFGSSLDEVAKSWYWGHAQLGPYTLVWWLVTGSNRRDYISGYVASDGEILKVGCDDGLVKVSPYGKDSANRPDYSGSLKIEYNLGEKGRLIATLEPEVNQVSWPGYVRNIGAISGGLVGNESHTGKALWDCLF